MARKAARLKFICDTCGTCQSLDKTKRHWCEVCQGSPVEMRCTRDHKPVDKESPATDFASLQHA